MKRIKTIIRSTMTDNSLNNRMFANIHLNLLNNINLHVQTVADDQGCHRYEPQNKDDRET